MSAAPTASNRIRQIAILVSSVDAAAAQQLLSRLPKDVARQVRTLAARIDNVAPEERRKILDEVQRSASAPSQAPSRPASGTDAGASAGGDVAPEMTQAGPSQAAPSVAQQPHSDQPAPQPDDNAPAWTRLSTEALAKFIRGERPAVIAVVINQLAPTTAVGLLQRLPETVRHDVLSRLSHLQEIDPEAMEAIAEHLSERLSEYQLKIESEMENSRRAEALLAAAPPDVRSHWHSLLTGKSETGVDQPAMPKSPAPPAIQAIPSVWPSPHPQHTVADLYDSAVLSATDVSDLPHEPDPRSSAIPSGATPEWSEDQAKDILPFPSPTTPRQTAPPEQRNERVDRSLIQIEFEQILELPPQLLAPLLSDLDSDTVLLALVGATPQFIQRFYSKLDKNDAKTLNHRLQQMGIINLLDVDEAQRRVVESAAKLLAERRNKSSRQAMPHAA